jgi:hypothetical protein
MRLSLRYSRITLHGRLALTLAGKQKVPVAEFQKSCFECGHVRFTAPIKPVSVQNNGGKRSAFKKELQQITCESEYIITGTCWIAIDYYCQHVRREKPV